MVRVSTRRASRLIAAASLAMITVSSRAQRLDTASRGRAQTVDTVSLGRARLDARAFAPFTDTIDLYLVLGAERSRTTSFVSTLEHATENGVDVLVWREVFTNVTYTHVANARTFAPLRRLTRATSDSAEIRFDAQGARGWAAPVGKPLSTIDVTFTRNAYPVAMPITSVISALPLAPGYTAAIPTFNDYQGVLEWTTASIVGSDTITYRTRPVDTWIVETHGPGVPKRYWIRKDTKHCLQIQNLMTRPDGKTLVSVVR